MTIDRALVEKVKIGDESAFKMLYDRYSDKIYSVARRMYISHEDAEGVVQDTFMTIWRKRSDLKPDLSFNSYLITIVKSKVIKMSHKNARWVGYHNYAISHHNFSINDTADQLILSDLSEFSNKMIENLPKKQRQIFKLKYFEDLTPEEISEKLNLSKRTVENQIYRATKTIKDRLTNFDIITFSLILIAFFN